VTTTLRACAAGHRHEAAGDVGFSHARKSRVQ
jgi:hypothetical protein